MNFNNEIAGKGLFLQFAQEHEKTFTIFTSFNRNKIDTALANRLLIESTFLFKSKSNDPDKLVCSVKKGADKPKHYTFLLERINNKVSATRNGQDLMSFVKEELAGLKALTNEDISPELNKIDPDDEFYSIYPGATFAEVKAQFSQKVVNAKPFAFFDTYCQEPLDKEIAKALIRSRCCYFIRPSTDKYAIVLMVNQGKKPETIKISVFKKEDEYFAKDSERYHPLEELLKRNIKNLAPMDMQEVEKDPYHYYNLKRLKKYLEEEKFYLPIYCTQTKEALEIEKAKELIKLSVKDRIFIFIAGPAFNRLTMIIKDQGSIECYPFRFKYDVANKKIELSANGSKLKRDLISYVENLKSEGFLYYEINEENKDIPISLA